MYSAQIEVRGEVDGLWKVLEKELRDKDRSSVRVEMKGSLLKFRITAEDATALRITLNTICKYIIVYEKMGALTWTRRQNRR
ncbi:CTAG/PCC1 family protein [Candidatus Woesearchaeota archaeon]|nr:CTAG/PCC1 family protein [Candidatus Woesearchaeota archaeon]